MPISGPATRWRSTSARRGKFAARPACTSSTKSSEPNRLPADAVPAELTQARKNALTAIDRIRNDVAELASANRTDIETCARNLAMSLSRTICGTLLIEHAAWGLTRESDGRTAISAQRWCERNMVDFALPTRSWSSDSRWILSSDLAPHSEV